MGVEEVAAGVMMTLAFAIAAPEGSVTCPRKVPDPGWDVAVCATASVAHNCNDKRISAKQRQLRPFIPLFHSTT
jgi:hypothetical protein